MNFTQHSSNVTQFLVDHESLNTTHMIEHDWWPKRHEHTINVQFGPYTFLFVKVFMGMVTRKLELTQTDQFGLDHLCIWVKTKPN